MQNNRDSSVLRSLAIAFGDGLAFGVGMKLTQRGAAQSAPAPPAEEASAAIEMQPLHDRLNEIEARIGKVERAPAAIASAPAPAPFDHKVLEAIVHALDARLLEQAGQVERRLTELEAKLAIELKSLQQQDHSVVTAVQTHIEELNEQIAGQLAAIRRQSEEERAALQQEIASLHREFAVEAAQAVEVRTAELRAEIASRDTQIADLQTQLEVGDEKLRNVVQAIARACDTVVGRSGASAAASSKVEPEQVDEPAPEPPLPGFARPRPEARSLPVQLVSSLALLAAAGFAMMHYL
jgi:hypothetical protein